MITIIDYGMGNTGSIRNMLKKVGAESILSSDLETIARAEKLILPGVGAFDAAMSNIEALGLKPVLHQKAMIDRTPVLGICLGMQLLTRSSEEGSRTGLGWIDATTQRLKPAPGIRVPHMGWNTITVTAAHPLMRDLPEDPRFYFVHSYSVTTQLPEDTIAATTHGVTFAAGIARDNIMGVQFHPERSHRFGAALLRNFIRL